MSLQGKRETKAPSSQAVEGDLEAVQQAHQLSELIDLVSDRVALSAAPPPLSLGESGVGVRVVGAFSSGKSSLISAMIKPFVHPNLLPLSSPERETALPLKISYGEADKGELSALDSANKRLDHLSEFPNRDVIKAHPSWRQLSLTAKIPQLITQDTRFDLSGALSAEQALSVSLIDTPGWNSGELAADQVEVATREAPALLFVTTARLIDDRTERENIEALLERLLDVIIDTYANVSTVRVITVITHAGADPTQRDAGRSLQERAEAFFEWLKELCGSLDDEALAPSQPHLIDFVKMSSAQVSTICEEIWAELGETFKSSSLEVKPVSPPSPQEVLSELLCGDPSPLLRRFLEELPLIERLLERARSGEPLLKSLNAARLLPFSAQRREEKIKEALYEYLAGSSHTFDERVQQLLKPLHELITPLPSSNPLAAWFNQTFHQELMRPVKDLKSLCAIGEGRARFISQSVTDDNLDRLRASLFQAQRALESNMRELTVYLPTLKAFERGEDPQRVLLTLFMAYHGRAQLRETMSA